MLDVLIPDAILQLRLANQHLARPHLTDPGLLVAHLGGMQAQDYPAAKWALAQRLCNATDTALERAIGDGVVLRTHVLRPTWHFVAPADIRWLLELTAPRIKMAMAYNMRGLGLDDALLTRSNTAIARALEGGNHLTRPELDVVLRDAGIAARDSQTLGHIVSYAELDGVICSGPWRGKQSTYALLDERAPSARRLERDAALAELTSRYFTSHGPATLRDFTWWSGLTVADARRGLDLSGPRFVRETVDGFTYWFLPTTPARMPEATCLLLPNYDEYTVAYHDRGLFYDRPYAWTPGRREDVPFGNVIVIDGRVAGMWKRSLRGDMVSVDARWFAEPSDAQSQAFAAAVEGFGVYLGRRVYPGNRQNG